MKLFGWRLNRQSVKSDVPPELQPYYGQPQGGLWRRARLLILPVLAAILLGAAAVGGVIWARTHKIGNPFHTPNSSSQTARGSQGSRGNGKNSQSSSPSGANGTGGQPSSPTGSGTQSQPSTNSDQAAAPGSASSIPNTGPGDTVLLISAAAGILGAAAYHARQLRRARLS